MKKERCKEMIWSNDRWPTKYQCTKPEWKDGYCKVHHPETVAIRNAASEAKYQDGLKRDILHRLADRLDTKYDLSKLEAATEQLLHAWENEHPEFVVLAVDNFLRAITRQPAGEKQSADTLRSEDSILHENQ